MHPVSQHLMLYWSPGVPSALKRGGKKVRREPSFFQLASSDPNSCVWKGRGEEGEEKKKGSFYESRVLAQWFVF